MYAHYFFIEIKTPRYCCETSLFTEFEKVKWEIVHTLSFSGSVYVLFHNIYNKKWDQNKIHLFQVLSQIPVCR